MEMNERGEMLPYKCVKGFEESGRCAEACVLGSARNRLDYSLYCRKSCSPALMSAGATCSRVHMEDSAVKVEAGSGGDEPSTEQSQPEATWQAGVDAAKKEAEKKAEAASKAKIEQRIVNWDMRKLVAQRLRAQTGADLAHGAAVGQEVKLHLHLIEQNMKRVTKIKDSLGHIPEGVDGAVAKAEGDAAKAKDTSRKMDVLFKAAKNSVGPSLAKTRAKALALIRSRADGLAMEAAEAYATRMDWDKPAVWPRILAQRASEPYQKAMVTAAQRFSEYRAASQQAERDASSASAGATELESVAASYSKQGDEPMAVDTRLRVEKLRTQALALSGKAKSFLGTAQAAWTSMEKWQEASQEAAAYVAQAYVQNHPDRLG